MHNCNNCAFKEPLECGHISCAKGGTFAEVPLQLLLTILHHSAQQGQEASGGPCDIEPVGAGVSLRSDAILADDGDWPHHFMPKAISRCDHFKDVDVALAEVKSDADKLLQKVMNPI